MADDDKKPSLNAVLDKIHKYIEADNVADLLSEDELAKISGLVVSEFKIDEQSRTDWEAAAKRSMDVALQVKKPKSWPWPNAANIKYPLVTVAALQFNARAYPAVVDGDKIVKARVVGADPDGAKREKADRISEHMSYQLGEEMEEWEGDTDTLLFQLPIVGDAHRKVYWDPTLGRPRSEMIPSIDVVVNSAVRAVDEAPRVTHVLSIYPNQIEERQRAGLWLDINLPPASSAAGDADAPHDVLEQHRFLDLDEDGYKEPYIVTVHKDTQKVVRIAANFGVEDVQHDDKQITHIGKKDYFVHYPFLPDPKGGYYGVGFGQLLESLGDAIDTTINQMIDAGTLQNAGGGFIGSGLRLSKAQQRMEPGVYKTVDASGATLRDAIYSVTHPGPSPVLFQLLGLLIEAARDITAVKDIMTGDTGERTQTATTTLALIEQGMTVFTAIYKRIYRSLKREFQLLYRINAENLPEEAYFTVLDTPKAVARTDYVEGDYDICPQADPRLVTDMQRLARANLVREMAAVVDPSTGQPVIVTREAVMRVLQAAGVEDIAKLMPEPEPQQPDPATLAAAEAEMAQRHANVEKTQSETAKNIATAEATQVDGALKVANALKPQEQPAKAAA